MRTRQIVLDTETTGLDPSRGHRVIEIGCVEICNRRLTGNHYQRYLQPDRKIDPEAMAVHGITDEFLVDKPRFADIEKEFVDFIRGAELLIHNAPFDVGFLNHELSLLGRERGTIEDFCRIVDTLIMARQMHPGQRNTLDALCKRYQVDNAQRTLHGALLDAEILADVYLAMTGGQVALSLDTSPVQAGTDIACPSFQDVDRPALAVVGATTEELVSHRQYLELLDANSGGNCLWKKLDTNH